MAVRDAVWVHGSAGSPSYTAEEDRQLLTAMFGARGYVDLAPQVNKVDAGGGHGVVNSGDLAVTQNGTPNMSVNVAAGVAVIRGTEAADQGCYVASNDATVNVAIAAADATNPRQDLVWIRVRDAEYSGPDNTPLIGVTTGTPAASPADPTPPENALVLARVVVAANDTAITNGEIGDLRTRAYALGGIAPCTSTTRPNPAYEGQAIYERDTEEMLIHNGVNWRRPWQMPWGILGYVEVTAVQTGITTVTDLTGLTLTITAVANRRLKITGSGGFQSSVDNDHGRLDITDGANVTIEVSQHRLTTSQQKKHIEVIESPSAGLFTCKLRYSRTVGTGTLQLNAAATNRAFLCIEDIGANGAAT